MLVSIGDLVEDIVVWLDGPLARDSDTPARIERRRGGSAANVAAFTASAGVAARFVGTVGADRAGDWLVDELTRARVDACVRRRGRSGSIVVVVSADGARSFLTDRGSCSDLGDIDDEWLAGMTWLHVPAYSLVDGAIAGESARVVALAHERGARTSVDCSSTGVLAAFGVDRFRALLARLRPEVVFANREEAALVELAARPLVSSATLGPVLIVKQGPDPVLVFEPGPSEQKSPEPIEIPVPSVTGVRDTTGAGDAFAAGFIAATLAGGEPAGAAAAGVALAQTVLRSPGASTRRATGASQE